MGSPMEVEDLDTDMDSLYLKSKLFHFSMNGEWENVIYEYKSNSSAYSAKITRSGDTALHIAVSDSEVNNVENLLDAMMSTDPTEAKAALKVKNAKGDTPLHLAASRGNVKMCLCIADKDPSLGGLLNHEKETPFFLAAQHGNKDAFLLLYHICRGTDPRFATQRNKEGDTILHVAIFGEYLDLAFQILILYKELAYSRNEKGITPLHLLASKPSVFRSGSHLQGYRKLIYHCAFVDELKPAVDRPDPDQTEKPDYLKYFPKNYETCINFLRLPLKAKPEAGKQSTEAAQSGHEITQGRHELLPLNYRTTFEIIKLVWKAFLVIVGSGWSDVRKIQDKKKKHGWSVQVMDQLIEIAGVHEYESTGRSPHVGEASAETSPFKIVDGDEVIPSNSDFNPPAQGEGQGRAPDTEKKAAQESIPWKSFLSKVVDKILESFNQSCAKDEPAESKTEASTLVAGKIYITEILKIIQKSLPELSQETPVAKPLKDTPILMAAKNGITEIVQKILEKYPVAIHDTDANKKNIVLLAVENRQPHVYKFLWENKKDSMESIFRQVDINGNSALHLAAALGDYKPWLIPGAALQMQWELRWFEFVKASMPSHFFVRYNKEGKTPKDVFTQSHQELVKNGGEWLGKTSESCSVVAALIATVAFATSATVPGGVKQENGIPTLEKEPAFNIFAISSLVALCFSVTALVMFLSILTSRYQEKDFGKDLPRKLLVGLTSLFVSIASILVSFCAGHFFVLKDKLKYAAFPVYAITCLPVTFYAAAQLPLYLDLIRATFRKVPQRSYMPIPP